MSALALELSQTPDATLRSATARAQGAGLAATRASSQSSSSNTGRSLASVEVKGRHRIMAELRERRSG
jgi:hypothetical protein